jgi:hypothetical protein
VLPNTAIAASYNHTTIRRPRKIVKFKELNLVSGRAKIEVPVDVVAPPRREGNRGSSGAEHGKGQDEQRCETGAVKCTCNQVRVVLEDTGTVVAEIELDKESSNDLAEDDASLGCIVRDIAGVLDELGHVDLIESEASNLGDKLSAHVSKGTINDINKVYLRNRRCGGQRRLRHR